MGHKLSLIGSKDFLHFIRNYFPYRDSAIIDIPVASIDNISSAGGKICRRCCRYRWCTFTYEYLCEFLKKFEMTLMLFSGAWGEMIHEKT
jgi:hypothetical protein